MSKILIFNGSPRKKGNTAILIEQVVKGLKCPPSQVKVYSLDKMKINPCRACDTCIKKNLKKCIQEDDLTPVYAELLDATAIILATPIYWFSVSAQMKLFIDRFYAFHTSEEYVFKEKPMAAVLVYGDKDPYNSGAVNAIYALKSMFKYNQAKFRKIIYGNAGKAGGVRENTSFMEDALKLGENMRVFLNP